jgi:hypothetical protein
MEIVRDRDACRDEGPFVPRGAGGRSIRNFAVRPDGALVRNRSLSGLGAEPPPRPEPRRRLGDVPGAGLSWVAMVTGRKFPPTRRGRPHRNNPYGDALLPRLWWPRFPRRRSWEFWGRYLVRRAAGVLVAQLDQDGAAPADELAAGLPKARQSAVAAIKGGTLERGEPELLRPRAVPRRGGHARPPDPACRAGP